MKHLKNKLTAFTNYYLQNIICKILIASFLLFVSCNSNKTQTDDEQAEHHDEHTSGRTTTLNASQMQSIKIEFGRIEKKQLTASLKAYGILKVPNQNKANATAALGGVIKSITVQTGNNVHKGEVIATIVNNAFIKLQEDYLSVSAKLKLAQQEFERQKALWQGKATALKKLQAAKAKLKVLQAQKASLHKQLALININTKTLTSNNIRSTTSIKSPIGGTISKLTVNIGSYVNANEPIAEIVDNSQLHLDLYVYEKDLQKIKVGQTIHFTLTNNPGKEYDADVFAISNTFEPNTKAVAVHAIVKGNKQGLIDGMNVSALISLENATVDAVPTDAIVSHEGQDYIFIVIDEQSEASYRTANESTKHGHEEHKPNNSTEEHRALIGKITTFERIPIRKGTTDIGYSEIAVLKNIPADSKVVINGAFFIMAKMVNKGEAHAH